MTSPFYSSSPEVLEAVYCYCTSSSNSSSSSVWQEFSRFEVSLILFMMAMVIEFGGRVDRSACSWAVSEKSS